MNNIDIILIEPGNSGNIGAIARVMANFSFKNLILVNPKVNHLAQTARNRAKHAQDILQKARVRKTIPKHHTLIATTSQLGTDYNIPRSPITPKQLAEILPKHAKIGLVFGRESTGLTNKEVQLCDFTVTIPADKSYPTLNLSQSVAIMLYELSSLKEGKTGDNILPASAQEKQHLLTLLNQSLNKLSFATKDKKQTQIKVWKRMISKSFLTKRESFALMGFLKKIINKDYK